MLLTKEFYLHSINPMIITITETAPANTTTTKKSLLLKWFACSSFLFVKLRSEVTKIESVKISQLIIINITSNFNMLVLFLFI